MLILNCSSYLELIEKVGDEKVELHARKPFAQTLTLADRERDHLRHRFEMSACVKEARGLETSRIWKQLEKQTELCDEFVTNLFVVKNGRYLRNDGGSFGQQVAIHYDVSGCPVEKVLRQQVAETLRFLKPGISYLKIAHNDTIITAFT